MVGKTRAPSEAAVGTTRTVPAAVSVIRETEREVEAEVEGEGICAVETRGPVAVVTTIIARFPSSPIRVIL